MRFQLLGEQSLDEFQHTIAILSEILRSNGIDSIRHINFYFQACSSRQQVKFINGGKEVDHFLFEDGVLKQNEVQLGDFDLIKAHELKLLPPKDS